MNYTGKQNDFSFCCKKITFCTQLCLLIIGLLASAFSIEAVAQNKPITLKLDNATVVEAVRAVEKQSTYKFVYNNADVDVSRKISVNIENATVETAAKTIFAGYNVTIKGKNVIITSPKKAGTNAKQQSSHRSKVIGAVVDAVTGDPLTGASVLVKNATPPYGVTADVDGKFELSVSPDDVLVVSFIGYLSQEVKIGNRKILSISLSEDATALGEVVVTAFNMGQKKATMTGSIQTLRPSDLKVPATNLSTAFAGRLSGVIAYQRSGEPGSNGADFFVRGVSTMSGATNPLIILDGVEVNKADLDALDPEVIEGFSVLKDATASAMYGTRGANGVLIIKTKSGANLDKPVISVRVEGYVNKPINVPQVVSPVMFMRMFNEAVTNQGTDALLYSEDKINGTLKGLDPYLYPNVDWYEELFNRSTFNQKANFNVRGGTSKITYFMNVNAVHETGMLKGRSKDFFSFDNNINYMKYAFQNNIDFNLSKTAKIGLNLNVQLNSLHGPITASDGGGGVGNIFNAIMQNNAVDFPILYPQGGDPWYHWGGTRIGSTPIENPMVVATAGYKDMFESTVVSILNYEQKLDFITKGLGFKALFSFKNWNRTTNFRFQGGNRYVLEGTETDAEGNTVYIQTPLDGNPSKPSLNAGSGVAGDRSYYFQSYFDYNRSFGNHNVSAMLLYNMSEYNNNVIGNNNLIGSLPKRKLGFAGRITYDYANRYLFEVNAGYNGSENFAKGHRFGFFPSVSAGWNVSEEKFWTPLKSIVSNFKIRASYGLVGNDQIGGERFIYMGIVSLNNTPGYITGYDDARTGERKGPTYSRLQNDNITWEIGRKYNVGVDLQFFNSLNLTIDAFKEIRSDIFQQKQSIPNSFGTADTKIFGNYAKVKNWGIDASVDYGKQVTKDFSLQFRGTFTFARNRVLEYDEAPGLRPALRQVGRRLNTYMGYVADGLYIDEADIANNPTSTLGNITIAPGDIKYVDQPDADGKYDGKITSDDRIEIGHPHVPEIVYGFGPSMKYKNIDLSFFFQGQANVSLMMSGFHPFGTQERRNVLQWIADDYWSKDNQNNRARYPRLTHHYNDNNRQESTYWLRNAAFLKLKNLEVGYTYKGMRVYASVTNLFTLSGFKLWDPELGGGSGMKYPLQRTFNVGVQVRFNDK